MTPRSSSPSSPMQPAASLEGVSPAAAAQLLARTLATPASLPLLLILGCLAASVSVGLQGFYFAVVNNSYHIPIVDGWLQDPQFATDGYIQSLRYHTSYVWPLAHLMAPFLGTTATFVLLHVANRVAMFVTLALLVRALGVRTAAGVCLPVMTLAVSRYLLAASGPGEHDLFMPFLNHSSLTWPFIFASWLFLLRGRIVPALALQGPVFAVNAFVAICGGPAVAAGALAFFPAERRARIGFALRGLAGFALALLIAGPTIAWIISSFTEQPEAAPFSFLSFLRSYYLKHWYITAASPRRLVSFAIVTGCGLACLHGFGPKARSLRLVWWGYLAIFAAGVALPYIADSRTLLVLHPMRVGAGCLVMLSVLAIVAALGRALESKPWEAQLAAAAGLLGLAIGQAGLLALAAAVITIPRLARQHPLSASLIQPPMRHSAPLLLVAGLLAVAGWRALREPPPYDVALLAAARETGLWIGAHTPPGSMVFVPSGAIDGEDDPVSVWARRPLWYDWKEGAAVMWTPSYYQEWSTRRREVADLVTVADVLAYACAKRIEIVVETAARFHTAAAPDQLAPVLAYSAALAYHNDAYAVLRVAPICATFGH